MAASTFNVDSTTAAATTIETETAPERPNNLFKHNENAMKDNAKQQTKYITTSASAGISPSTSPSSVTSATSPTSFLPEMPQWKKDLIQRRKSNVARTTAAATAITPTANSPTTIAPTTLQSSPVKTTATTTGESRSINDHAAGATTNSNDTSQEPKMPVTNTQVKDISPTSAINTAGSWSSGKEKSEQNIGGHYTQVKRTDLIDQNRQQQSETVPIPKQRSAINVTSHTKDTQVTCNSLKTETPQEYASTKESEACKQQFNSNTTTTTAQMLKTKQQQMNTTIEETTTTRLTSSSLTLREQEFSNDVDVDFVEVEFNASGTYSAQQQQSTTTSTGANPPLQQNSYQSHLKYESERAWVSNSSASVLTPVSEKTTSPIPIVCGKISNKLQNNNFIKNQQAGCSTASIKYLKHKSYSVQENTLNSASSVTGSPTKTSANTANTCAIKKKMVAVQEMKKTQNASHQQQIIGATACTRNGRNQESHDDKTDFDPSEDLSYGPGIVSKLRCRYLSLALSQSRDKQRHCVENLRRATSLNNLLDRDEPNDDDEEEVDIEEEKTDVELRLNTDKSVPAEGDGKIRSGILKHTNDTNNQESLVNKKTATFQQYGNKNTSTKGGTSRMSQSQNGNNVTTTGSSVIDTNNRSRHLKRGNDSLKRARSVEALLCEKSSWNLIVNHTSLNATNNKQSTPTCVTIEDKINNARERLIMGTDSMPPKRLTSIIDDTERPPPDLVKQTLKMFEATANRRPRPTRTNSKGDVANKVANYKSIINENKPPIIFPKPTSPTKKLGTQSKINTKPVMAADLLGSPVGRKATATITGTINTSTPENQNALQAAKFKTAGNNVEQNITSVLSDNSPDIIPKQKLLEKSELTSMVDSPVSALAKKLEKLSIDQQTDKQTKQSSSVTTKESQIKQQQQTLQSKLLLTAEVNTDEHNTENNDGNKFVGGDAAIIDDKNDRTSAAVAEDRETAQTGTASTSSDHSDDEYGLTKRVTKTALDNIAKAGTTQQFKFAGQTLSTTTKHSNIINGSSVGNSQISTYEHTNTEIPTSVLNAGKQIGIIRPILTSNSAAVTATLPTTTNINNQHMETLRQHSNYTTSTNSNQQLTSREIEKNRINEMKKCASVDATHAVNASTASACATTSLDTVINTNTGKAMSGSSANASGFNELDAVRSTSNSPLWALRKKRQPAAPENTSMVFNFSNRKEVPDYIENDVIIRTRRELPKPNESGFVLLGDLSLETSTDTDYDEFSMGPPSPCDVEFENANIVIDGKSSIRKKPKESMHHVQFNDTLTSTFEYPSEASLILDDTYDDGIDDDLINPYDNLSLDDVVDSPAYHRHHHVAVDEIIPLPTQHVAPTNATVNTSNTPTKNILGNLPLGSAPLGLYTPIKAPIDNMFQLGVTRTPNGIGSVQSTTSNNSTATNGNNVYNGNGNRLGSVIGIKDGLNGDNGDHNNEDPDDSLKYIKPAHDDLTIAYSEGTQKPDLLY